MAGKNQHFIPQFLQKGFATAIENSRGFGKSSKKLKKEVSVWVFDSTQKSYCTSTRNKGAERFFYGLENSVVDTTITRAETKYANIVNKLRQHTSSVPIKADTAVIANLVSHLFVRTKHTRDSGEEAYGILLEMLEELFGDTAGFESFLRNAIEKNSDVSQARFKQRFREATPQQQKAIKKKLEDNPNLVSETLETIIAKQVPSNPLTEEFFQPLKEEKASTAKSAHIKSLTESIAPQIRTDRLSQLYWFIHVEKENSFILGDAIVFCRTVDREYKPYMNTAKDIDCIFFPISSKHILIGMTSDSTPVVDVDILNQASAAISREFFIASQNTQREKDYSLLVNTNSSITSDSELEEIKKAVQKEWFS